MYNRLLVVEPVKNQYLYIKFRGTPTSFLYNENNTIGFYFEQMITVVLIVVQIIILETYAYDYEI